MEHLVDDDVEEGVPGLHLDQRLRLGHPHARAESAVQLEHDDLVDRRPIGLRELLGLRQVGDRLDLRLRQEPLLPLAQTLLVVGEGVDGGRGQARRAHLLEGDAHRRDPTR
jgi:hypothetical protein